jgi:DNA segregation ATPase FtsK/SpoIIIE-like protein
VGGGRVSWQCPEDSAPVCFGSDTWGRPLVHDFARSSSHCLITGVTRSGKSSLEYTLLSALSSRPFVRVVGCDPSGLLLSPFAHRGEGLVALGERVGEHVRVLESCAEVMDRRLSWLLDRGMDKMVAFTPSRPLLVVVMEEELMLAQLAKACDAASSPRGRDEARIKALLLRLLAGGAKCGIRVVVSMQRPDAEILGGAARSQLETRFLLRSDEQGIRMAVPELDDTQRLRLSGALPGVGFYMSPGVDPTMFRGVRTDYPQYRQAVLTAC